MRSLRNPNRMPTHPGAVLREDVLPELGWTQTELAARLMVSRQTVSDLLHEKSLLQQRWLFALPVLLAVHQRAGFACKKPWIFGLPR